MDIVYIGAGNVASHLSLALKDAGHNIVQIFSRTKESSKAIADCLNCEYVNTYSLLRRDADLYIISVKDDVLYDVSSELAKINIEGLVVHTSGSMTMDTIKSRRRGVLYPLQTFSKNRKISLADVPFFIESNNNSDLKLLIKIAHSISNNVNVIDSDKRKYLHLSAIFCNNFVNHFCTLADTILKEQDISFKVMMPLLNETINKLQDLTPSEAQTGPAIRYDVNVINKHISMLSHNKDIMELYSLISENIHKYHSNFSQND